MSEKTTTRVLWTRQSWKTRRHSFEPQARGSWTGRLRSRLGLSAPDRARSSSTSARVSAILLSAALTGLSTSCSTQPPAATPPPPTALPAESARVAFQSLCAQNVITCTTSWPVANAEVVAGEGQNVWQTEDGGYVVEGSDGDGAEPVNLVGSNSTMGSQATELAYQWSYGATDDDTLTLAPGTVFAVAADVEQTMADGLHYVRLMVVNDTQVDAIVSTNGVTIAEDAFLYDFVELEIEVRD